MKKRATYLVRGVKSVTDFLSDAVDAFKDISFVDAIEKSLPWSKAVGEALPPVKFIAKIAEDLLKETDPEKLGLTACTLAYQNAVEIAFKQIGNPTGERQSIKEAKDQLRALEHLEEIDMGTFSLGTPQQHEFYTQATLCLQVAAIKVGYTQSQVDSVTEIVQENFRHSLTTLLSSGDTKEKFEPFTEYLKLGGADEKRARKMLAQHANYQRWLFEQAPVLRVSPFALKHIYIETDCGQLRWKDINEPKRALENKIDPFNEQYGGRQPLLETVLELIGSEDLTEAIIIQGVPGAGKSSFTLKLCDELLNRKLHPIRVRIKELSFDRHIKDALPKAVEFTDEDYPEPEPFSFDDLFLNGTIFADRGIGQYAHICKYILILDGWDGISLSDKGFKKKVAQMLNQINDHYLKQKNPRIRVILTGRPSSDIGETQCLRDKTQILTIRKLRPEHLKKYVDKIASAVNTKVPLIEKNEQTENWTVPPLDHFEPVFEKYQKAFEQQQQQINRVEPVFEKYRKAFEQQQQQTSKELDVLGLPLLTYLTMRLVAEWQGDLSPLLENTTTLYRHLIDLTCTEASKGEVGSEDSGNQYIIYGEKLRQLLWQTAAAITMSGEENISRKELASRLDKEEKELDMRASELDRENKLSSLLISFYFKGGHSNLGCEFAHTTFREYLFAESIVEVLKDFGRKQKQPIGLRENYWEDFSGNKPNDFRFEFSRGISERLAPQWLISEVRDHVHQLIAWEIERAVNPDGKKHPGLPTEPLNWEEWKQVRTGLADLWEWWGEGAHLRPQPYRDIESGAQELTAAYINKLVKWDAPRDSQIMSKGYARTTTMDAHLGDGLFHLCALVHAYMAEIGQEIAPANPRKYQSIRERDGKQEVLFKPSGEHENYFLNYIARINSAGWRPSLFPAESYMHLIYLINVNINRIYLYRANLSGANLSDAYLSSANLSYANLSGANLSSAYLRGAYFIDADLSGADLSDANLRNANLSRANLSRANLSGTNLSDADLSGTNLSGADLSIADLSNTDLIRANLSGTYLSGAYLSGADLSGANLSSANLSGANLSGANLSSANLIGASLGRADLIGANLIGADLSGADLSHAYLALPSLLLIPEITSALEKARFDFIYFDQEKLDRSAALQRLRKC